VLLLTTRASAAPNSVDDLCSLKSELQISVFCQFAGDVNKISLEGIRVDHALGLPDQYEDIHTELIRVGGSRAIDFVNQEGPAIRDLIQCFGQSVTTFAYSCGVGRILGTAFTRLGS
jgi:hypothetical protein